MYLLLEYCDRGSLRDVLESGEFSLAARLQMAIDVVDAVDVLHRANVLHCDIKSPNIFAKSSSRGDGSIILKIGDLGESTPAARKGCFARLGSFGWFAGEDS